MFLEINAFLIVLRGLNHPPELNMTLPKECNCDVTSVLFLFFPFVAAKGVQKCTPTSTDEKFERPSFCSSTSHLIQRTGHSANRSLLSDPERRLCAMHGSFLHALGLPYISFPHCQPSSSSPLCRLAPPRSIDRPAAAMAAATACASTSLAGQSLLQPANELARKVGTSQARITMRKASSGNSGSYWYVFFAYALGFQFSRQCKHL